jgi:hypothetical protein
MRARSSQRRITFFARDALMFLKKSSKRQHPSSRETSNSKPQTNARNILALDVWSFSGCWRFGLGASFAASQLPR